MCCLKDLPFTLGGFWRVWQGGGATCTGSSYQHPRSPVFCTCAVCPLPQQNMPSRKTPSSALWQSPSPPPTELCFIGSKGLWSPRRELSYPHLQHQLAAVTGFPGDDLTNLCTVITIASTASREQQSPHFSVTYFFWL